MSEGASERASERVREHVCLHEVDRGVCIGMCINGRPEYVIICTFMYMYFTCLTVVAP